MVDLILESIFLGFSVYTILYIFISSLIIKNIRIFNKTVDYSAVVVVRTVGIFFILALIYNLIKDFTSPDYVEYSISNRIFGPYWFGFWIYVAAYFILTQLLWIQKIREYKLIRFIIAIFILKAFSLERILIILTSLNRDYLPSSWGSFGYGFSGNIYTNLILQLVIFITVVWITTVLLKFKNKNAV